MIRHPPPGGPVRTGFYATVDGRTWRCEAPYAPRVRLLGAPGAPAVASVDREDVDLLVEVRTSARWRGRDVDVVDVHPDGLLVTGAGTAPGVTDVRTPTFHAVAAADELTDVVERELLVRRRRPVWVLPADPDPTLHGLCASVDGELLPAGEVHLGMLPVTIRAGTTVGDALVPLGEVAAMALATASVRWQGRRWSVGTADGEVAMLGTDDGRTEVAPLRELTDVVEELRERPVPVPRADRETRSGFVTRLRPDAGPPELVTWVEHGPTGHRELRDLAAAVHRTDLPALVALVVDALPRLRAADPARDDGVGYLRLDWTLRVLTPLWLDAAARPRLAAALRATPAVVDDTTATALHRLLVEGERELEAEMIAVRRGPRTEIEEAVRRADRTGGPADVLVRVSHSVPVSRAVGRCGRRPREVEGVAVLAAKIRRHCARIVSLAGVPPEVRPSPAGVTASVGDLLRRAAG